MKRLILAPLLAGFAFAASAQGVAVAVDAQASADQATTAYDATADNRHDKPHDRIADRRCLRFTGSRIVARHNTSAPSAAGVRPMRSCAVGAGRVYYREDLDMTGEVDIAEALRKLDPAIH